EDYEERRFERQSLENVEVALRVGSLKMMLSPAVEIITAAGTCLMLGYGAHLVLAHKLTGGGLVLFLIYLGKMYKPMRDLSTTSNSHSKPAVGVERIREILETESRVRDLPGARQAPTFKGAIEFENVSFGYSSDERTLEGVNFKLEAGKVAA